MAVTHIGSDRLTFGGIIPGMIGVVDIVGNCSSTHCLLYGLSGHGTYHFVGDSIVTPFSFRRV